MGLNYHVAREVLRARPGGIERVATLGHLRHYMSMRQAIALDQEFGVDGSRGEDSWASQPYGSYAKLLEAAGAREVVVVDASDYEGADTVHDMNKPIGDELCQRFDQVIDGGTLEHVFRSDQALSNMMRMAKVAGSIIIWTPANNLCGHGFYQFSPEFFFSALSERTGFEIVTATVVEASYPSVSLVPARGEYKVRSPVEVGGRVSVVNKRPLMMLVRAIKRVHLDEPFSQCPQQSDYLTAWAEGAPQAPSAGSRMKAYAARAYAVARASDALGPVARHALGIRERRLSSLRNRRFFSPE